MKRSFTSFSPPLPRRRWLSQVACGFGALALHDLVHAASSPLSARHPGARPKAKRVIFLFMQGGPSQQDLFDPKEHIRRKHGETISAPINPNELRVGTEKFLALAPIAEARPRGQSGVPVSDLLPHLTSVVDDICLLRAMHADNNQHAPATLQLHTGAVAEVRPSMGSWISYGLGTENQSLPSFISIHPDADVRTYGAAFLPAAHQGTKVTVPMNEGQSAIDFLRDPRGDAALQRRRLDFVQSQNRRLLEQAGTDARMQGMIESMEVAFRMQTATPELVDLSRETEATKALYGVGGKATDRNARACLLARRLSEAGVRFVQVTMGGWDHHGDIRSNLARSCEATDQPCAALIKDLKSRGLLEDTLVVWTGEFGRTPWSQDLSGTSPIDRHGREHQPESFCSWLAGGGIQPGLTWGETDEFGFRPLSGKVHMHDLHATILHQLGIDHTQLTHRHLGRDFRLTDVYGEIVHDILA